MYRSNSVSEKDLCHYHHKIVDLLLRAFFALMDFLRLLRGFPGWNQENINCLNPLIGN